ncbi:unnamed protein product [Somion occarium]|uniref:Vomeronasal type-1 receptor n=1 Tax=Somion occarium TaxID=3059160 RepID=A0ABP1D7W2_9APHY
MYQLWYGSSLLSGEQSTLNLVLNRTGTQAILCFQTLRRLWVRKPSTHFIKFLFCYTVFLGMINTIWVVTAPFSIQATAAWWEGCSPLINFRPGRGVFQCSTEHLQEKQRLATLLDTISVVAYIVCTFCVDALLIWRCRHFWEITFSRYANQVVILPLMMLIGALVSSMFFFPETARPLNNIYLTILLSNNILLTSLIIARLTYCKRNIQKLFDEAHTGHYTFISAMFVESAAFNAVSSILMIATILAKNDTFQIWYAIDPAIQACSSYFIIYRGLQGIRGSWSDDPLTREMSSVVFVEPELSRRTDQASAVDRTDHTETRSSDHTGVSIQDVGLKGSDEVCGNPGSIVSHYQV